MKWVAILAILVLGGCVPFPVYKTLQPQLEITVVDDQNEPIHGAIVALISSSNPYGEEKSREVRLTHRKGGAKFQRRSEWRIEVLIIHGIEDFFWNWCIEKEGFLTYETQYGDDEILRRNTLIELEPGKSEACAVPYQRFKL
jgi:hypothetical protein